MSGELCSSFGEKGIRAARVADKAVCAIRKYLLSEAPVGEYLADQLLLPMALAGGGEFLCTEISSHTRDKYGSDSKIPKGKILGARAKPGFSHQHNLKSSYTFS